MSYAAAQAAYQNAAARMATQDYTGAIDQLMAAQALMAAIPDSGRTGDTVTFGRQVDGLLTSARERERTLAIRKQGGPQSTRVVYRRDREFRGFGGHF